MGEERGGGKVGYGYPDGALERLQEEELGILKEVARVCAQLNLVWFMDSGSCLGALRHGGFIPWDDDIDVALPLADYRTFCAEAPALLSEGFGLYTHAETANYPPLWAKVYRKGTRFMSQQMADAGFEQGIFVDVFAFSRLDSRPRTAKRQMRMAARWQRLSYLRCFARPKLPDGLPLRPVFQLACRMAHGVAHALLSPAFIERRFERSFSMGDGAGPWCDLFYPAYGTFETETLFPPVDAAFAGERLPVPHDADAYLATMYGDYRALPPEDKRGAYPPVVLDFGDGINVMEQAR